MWCNNYRDCSVARRDARKNRTGGILPHNSTDLPGVEDCEVNEALLYFGELSFAKNIENEGMQVEAAPQKTVSLFFFPHSYTRSRILKNSSPS